MSTVALSLNSPIIGISFERMNAAGRKLDRAREEALDEVDSLSRAISSLQVSDGRLRMKAEALNSMRSRINSRTGSLQRMSTHVGYAVKRFKETDSLCEQRIRSNGYECRKVLGLKTHGGLFGDIIGGIVSIVDKGKAAWDSIAKTVVDFYEKHKVLINNIATIALEVGAVALTVAAIAAGAVTGVGLVLGVIGLAYSLSNIIDSGTKIYNYCTTGVEKGFNPLQEGFQAVLGEELGKKVYDYSNIALGVANIAVAGAGLIKAVKNAWKSGKTLKDIFKIGNKAIGKEGRLIQNAANEEKAVEGVSNATKSADSARNIAHTGGLRNELPLTEKQAQELTDYAKSLGFPEDDIVICSPDNTNNTGLLYGQRLYINNDVLPSTMKTNAPNSLISGKGTIAHEIVGHYETVSKGTAFKTQYTDIEGVVKYNLRNLALDEAQASIRAARFAPDLSQSERIMLMRDGLTRLKNQGIKLKDVKRILDIFER